MMIITTRLFDKGFTLLSCLSPFYLYAVSSSFLTLVCLSQTVSSVTSAGLTHDRARLELIALLASADSLIHLTRVP